MFKLLLKDLFRIFGIELQRIPKIDPLKRAIPPEMRALYWLKELEIKTVLDIGANEGQFAQGIIKLLPNAKVYSFEPLSRCYEKLVTSLGDNPSFKAFNVALGNETGEVSIYENEYSPSSSLLPLGELHKKTFPFAKEVVSEKVRIVKLDDLSKEIELCEPILIKIDVQGFEDKVIEGGEQVFESASVIIIELSIVTLYEGQKLFDDIYQKLISLGFYYYCNLDQAQDTAGKTLYVDSIFVKNTLVI